LNWTYGGYYLPNDTVNIVVGTSLDIGVEFEYGEWIPLGEEWDYPNNTTHSYLLNRNHPNFHLTNSMAHEKGYNILGYDKYCMNPVTGVCDCNPSCYGEDYALARQYYFDYNSDGLLDMIGFLFAFAIVDPYSSINGKYILVDDALGNAEKYYGDIELRFGKFGPLGDFNSDGLIDLIIGGEEGHVLADGTYGEFQEGRYITINQDKSISYRTFSSKEYHHDAATGDIDNDGDTDIMFIGQVDVAPIGTANQKSDTPVQFLNDGSGNLVEVPLDSFFLGYTEKYQFDDPNTERPDRPLNNLKNNGGLAIKMFDLDDDGLLDIVVGAIHNLEEVEWSVHYEGSRVYWNQGNGVFDVDEFSELPNGYPKDQYSSIGDGGVTVLGFNFIDYDVDGDYDIVGALTPAYNGYIIQIHENLGNRQFRDVTESIVDDYDDISQQPESEFVEPSNFYNPIILDIDDDGDLDILPHYTGGINDDMTIQIYWENRSGKFYRSY
jgi:hypothetical protein